MATDKSLTTLLRALQRPSTEHDASRLLASATTLLTLLANPLNITLLTSQLLLAPAVWQNSDGLQIPLRILGVFSSASQRVLQDNIRLDTVQPENAANNGVKYVDWARAAATGADERSSHWKHLLVLGGLLHGLSDAQGLVGSRNLRYGLEKAVVDATNTALLDQEQNSDLAAGTICLTLGHTFKSIRPTERARLRSDLLLPIITQQLLRSREGLQWGYFLGVADRDITEAENHKFSWPPSSPSFFRLQKLNKSPLISCLGSLSQVLGMCAANVPDVDILFLIVDEFHAFSRSLAVQWRQNKLSEVDRAEESEFLDSQTLTVSAPFLWQVLRPVVFATVVVLQSILGRTLYDRAVPSEKHTFLASETLLILRNLYFVSSRMGHHTFAQYSFVYMSAIDILSRHTSKAEEFMVKIIPTVTGVIPEHPQDRCLDLFFFNIAEHFALVLPPSFAKRLLSAVKPYLGVELDTRLRDIFESAHSVVLSTFSAPHNATLVTSHISEYINILLQSFPGNLSARQFRLAIKTLVRVVSPPNSPSQTQPQLASAILEAVLARFESTTEARPPPNVGKTSVQDEQLEMSEKEALFLTLVDSLPTITPVVLEDWLPIVARALRDVKNTRSRSRCETRFWEIISNGEMDVPRAEICVHWWNNRLGQEAMLGSDSLNPDQLTMSGALPELSKL